MKPLATLSKYPSGSIREFAWLTGSFALVFLFLNLMGFVDRIFLARHSLESLEICVSATSLIAVFQMFCMRIAHTTQIFIGERQGAKRLESMGPCVWQSIWFSLFSTIAIVPIGWIIGPRFFAGTHVEELGLSYFYILLWMNFLFPLGASLSSFYLGRGHSKIVLICTILCCFLHIGLDAALIFGLNGYWPPLGALGSAWALAFTQLGFCAFLFADFLKKENRRIYRTDVWMPDWNALKYSLRIGMPRSISALGNLGILAVITKIMIGKGGEYAIAMAFGSSILVLTQSLATGFAQAASCAGAYALGTQSWPLFWKVYKSGGMLVLFYGVFLTLPCLFFPNIPIALFFKEPPSPLLYELLSLSCICLWLTLLAQGFMAIAGGMLTANRDTLFHMLFNLTIGWMLYYFPTYFAIEISLWPPFTFFLCVAFACFGHALGYYIRLRREYQKTFRPKEIY